MINTFLGKPNQKIIDTIKHNSLMILKTVSGNEYYFDATSHEINGNMQYWIGDDQGYVNEPYSQYNELSSRDALVNINDQQNAISSIRNNSFRGCLNLSSVTLLNVQELESNRIFHEDINIKILNFPKVKVFDSDVFGNLIPSALYLDSAEKIGSRICGYTNESYSLRLFSLSSVLSVPTVETDSFEGLIKNNQQVSTYIPQGMFEQFRTAPIWSDLISSNSITLIEV